MYISDKDALQYSSRAILLLMPVLSSLFLSWSWIIEIILLFAVFIHARGFGLRSTIILLALGYLISIFPLGIRAVSQIGFTPWAGVLLLLLIERGLSLGQSMLWSITLAALISALPTVPSTVQALEPDILQQRIEETVELYQQRGTLESFEEQGIPRSELEGYIRLAVPVYYKLLPGIAGILGMLEIGIAYLGFRLTQRKNYRIGPFAFWRLPWYTVWIAITGLALYLGGEYLGNSIASIAGMNTMLIMAAMAMVLGLSCAAYFLQQPRIPRVLILLTVLSAVFFTYYVMFILILIGLFDLVLNLRRIPEKSEGEKQ